jgi:hypothetical protein
VWPQSTENEMNSYKSIENASESERDVTMRRRRRRKRTRRNINVERT